LPENIRSQERKQDQSKPHAFSNAVPEIGDLRKMGYKKATVHNQQANCQYISVKIVPFHIAGFYL
jgi:hypothetical protein